MKYNIGFTLGDPVWGGHACTTDYHIVANHSADEIFVSIQTQIEFNQQVAEDNSKYISKLKDLIS